VLKSVENKGITVKEHDDEEKDEGGHGKHIITLYSVQYFHCFEVWH